MNKYLLEGKVGGFIVWRKKVEAEDAESAVAIIGYDSAKEILVRRILGKGELLPCPFCGGKAEVRNNPRNPTFEDWVECTNRNCGARTASDDSYKGAVNIWNKRANVETFPCMEEM